MILEVVDNKMYSALCKCIDKLRMHLSKSIRSVTEMTITCDRGGIKKTHGMPLKGTRGRWEVNQLDR